MLKRKGYSDELFQAKMVIAELLGKDAKSLSFDNLSSNELEELKVFVEDPTGLNIYNLPGFLGDCFLESKTDKNLWKSVSKLGFEDRKILVFSALGYDPAMIGESLNFSHPGIYWEKLGLAKEKLEDSSKEVYNEESLRSLTDSLDMIISNYLLASDLVDIVKQQSKRKKTYIIGGTFGAIILTLSYLFFWNVIFPPNVELIFENRIDKIQQYIFDSGDTTELVLEALDNIAIADYKAAGQLFEQQKLSTTIINPGIQVLEILLLLRENEFFQVKTLSEDLRSQNPEVFSSHLKGIRWKIRFLYLYQ